MRKLIPQQRSSAFVVAFVVLTVGCGRGVDTLAITAPPLAVVRGHFDLTRATAAAQGHKLRAAVVWGAVPNYVLACFKYPDDPVLAKYCPDPFGFVPGTVGGEVEIDPARGGDFTIPITRLPDAGVSVGSDAARVAWGSLIVAADTDDSGTFGLVVVRLDREPIAGIQPFMLADVPVAASFVSLKESQGRIVYREGGWDSRSLFYPTPGCAPPPAGFSLVSTPGMCGELPDPYAATTGDCSITPTEAKSLDLPPLEPDESIALACRSVNLPAVRPPEPGLGKGPCVDDETIVAPLQAGGCSVLIVMPLAGCSRALTCDPYDWDLRSNPPDWWPCGH